MLRLAANEAFQEGPMITCRRRSILAPFLAQAPDTIRFTGYEEI